jgi:ribosomal protein L25 (general stress protein Ctc)
MSNIVDLKVTERDTTLTPRQLRAAGFVPATLYGKGIESQSIQVKTHELTLAMMHGAREFSLQGLPGDMTARVQQIQTEPVSQKPLSVEFLLTSPAPGGAKKAEPAAKKATSSKKEAVLTGA